MKTKRKRKPEGKSGPPRVRLPLPAKTAKTAKRHGDKKKYDRKWEKERPSGEL